MTSGGADSGPNAGSNLVQGVGTNTATFTLPGTPRYKVESVVAEVDNSAGGDTTGTLTMADQSGQVVAAVDQGRVLSAGVTGRATWALRLTDEQDLSAITDGLVYTALQFGAGGGFLGVTADERAINPTALTHNSMSVVLTRVANLPLGMSLSVTVQNDDTHPHSAGIFTGNITRLGTGQNERFTSNTPALAPHDNIDLEMAHASGAAILSYTTPAAPTVPATDNYAVTVAVTWTA